VVTSRSALKAALLPWAWGTIVDPQTMAADRDMEIGERVPLPSSLQLPAGWVEMRRIWSAKSTNMLAILYRLIEMYQANPNFGMPESFFTDKQMAKIRQKKQEELKDDLRFIAELTENQLHPIDFNYLYENPMQVQEWGVKLAFPASGTVINADGSVEIAIHFSGENLFLLYSAYSLGNFVDLECGHFAFKYDYYQRMQQLAQGTAVSLRDMERFGLVCFDCGKLVSPSLLFPQVPAKKPVSTLNSDIPCRICGTLRQISSGNCPAKHKLCERCFLKNCLTENYLCTPCCKQPVLLGSLSTAVREVRKRPSLKQSIEKLPHLQHIETTPIPERICDKCQMEKLEGEAGILVCRSCALDQQVAQLSLVEDVDDASYKKQRDERSKPSDPPQVSATDHLTRSAYGTDSSYGKPRDRTDGRTTPLNQSSNPGFSQHEEKKHNPERDSDVPEEYQTHVISHAAPVSTEERKELNSPNIHPHSTADLVVPGTKCHRCKLSYTILDRDWQCSKRCYCSLCMAALVIGDERRECPYCNTAISEEMMVRLKRKWVRCHSCGLAMALDEIVEGVDCYVCKACVIVTENTKTREVKCYECTRVYSAFEKDYEGVKRLPVILQRSACCNFSITNLPFKKLTCNHLICCRHFHLLKRCRNCHKPAVVVEDQ